MGLVAVNRDYAAEIIRGPRGQEKFIHLLVHEINHALSGANRRFINNQPLGGSPLPFVIREGATEYFTERQTQIITNVTPDSYKRAQDIFIRLIGTVNQRGGNGKKVAYLSYYGKYVPYSRGTITQTRGLDEFDKFFEAEDKGSNVINSLWRSAKGKIETYMVSVETREDLLASINGKPTEEQISNIKELTLKRDQQKIEVYRSLDVLGSIRIP